MSGRPIGFGGDLDVLQAEANELRHENQRLLEELQRLTDVVMDEDGAARRRSEPNGPAYCQGCLSHGRLIRLISQQRGAGYYCQGCERRWIRPTREAGFMQEIHDANRNAFTDFDPPLC